MINKKIDFSSETEFLKILMSNLTSAVLLLDKDMRIKEINDYFGTLFKNEEDKFFGKYCGRAIGCEIAVESVQDCGNSSECQNCDLRNSVIRSFIQNIPTIKEKCVKEIYYDDKKVTKTFLYSTKKIILNNEELFLIIIDDISKLEDQKVKLEELNSLKNQFLAVAAHDLRNPISVIISFADLMQSSYDEFSDEEILEYLKIICDSGNNALKLLNNLLDISKIESGKIEINKTNANYSKFLHELVSFNRIFAEKKNIQINVQIPDIEFEFDMEKISQVVNNLISNSIKFSYSGAEININAYRENGYIITQFIDNGQGIKKEELDTLFTLYKTTSIKTTANEKSTGLGLTIVKKIIEEHGGTITVESIYGKGSNFQFSLPAN